MQWTDVCRMPEVHTSLQPHGEDLRAVSEHTPTFYLSGTARPDPYQHAFFTGRGTTPEQAEQVAYTVYLRAYACAHEFTPHDPV